MNQFKQHRNTPPPSHAAQAQAQAAAQQQQQQQQQQMAGGQRLPPMLPPHHYSHPSLSPLMAARSSDPQQQQQYRQGGVTEIGALLNGPGEAQAGSATGSPQQSHQQPPGQQQDGQATHGVKRPGSPLEQPQHTPQPEGQLNGSPHVGAGSIPNSPRNERREAPASSTTAAAYRASN